MPTYDYQCLDCSTSFEASHSIGDGKPDCPVCGGSVNQLFLKAPAVHGESARGRDLAIRSLDSPAPSSRHVPACSCCHSH